MRTGFRFITVFVGLITFLFLVEQAHTQPSDVSQPRERDDSRLVAATIDDLPVVGPHDLQEMQELTSKLLNQTKALEMPVIGFVNEGKLERLENETDGVALLEQWLDAGHDLGNHTYAHPSLFDTPLADYEADVLRGEAVTKQLLEKRDKQIQYFRHPYLNTGPDLETKTAFEQFLADHGYTIAPVTIDSDEYIYALAYNKARAAGERAVAAKVGRDYVRYMEEMFVFYEHLSHDLLGREPAQILLLHANALNADYLDELAAMMRERGYAFTTLDLALRDSAYALPDQYAGQSGLSWLQRWWTTQGHERREEPHVPDWIRKIAYPDQ